MHIVPHEQNGQQIAEVISEDLLITNPEEGLQLLADLYYQGFDRIVVHEKNLAAAFFDLKTGLAGEVLQKFSNYRVRLAIVGGFEKYSGKSISDFIYESNAQGHVVFVASLEEALNRLGG